MFENCLSVISPLMQATVFNLNKMRGFFCSFLVTCLLLKMSEALVKREAPATATPLLNLTKVQHRMEEFQSCVDKHLANVVGDVQTDQLQPVLNVIGDQVFRLAKAWDVLTAPKSTPSSSDDDD